MAAETPAPTPESRPPVLASLAPFPSMRTRSATPEPQRPGYKIGPPYTIGDRTYVPAEDPNYDAVGIASWYGQGFHGGPTASGETYDQDAMVAAHPTLPMPSYVLVTNLRNGRTVMVRVNNRGPYKDGRIIDLSRKAAELLGFAGHGLTQVRVKYAGRAPLDGSTDRERAHLSRQPWYRAAAAQLSQTPAVPDVPANALNIVRK